MKAFVDADLCTGCGLCTEACPEVFQMGDDNVAVVITESVPIEVEETCQQAAEDCPVEAILTED